MVTGSKTSVLLSSGDLSEEFLSGAHLSILIDPSEIQWAVTQRSNRMIHEVGALPLPINNGDAIGEIPEIKVHLLNRKFASVSLAVRGGAHTLVPKGLYSEEAATNLLHLTGGHASPVIQSEEVPEIGAVLIYELPAAAVQLTEHLPAVQAVSNARLMISSILGRSRNQKGVRIYADIASNFTDVYAVANARLMLCNSFPTNTPEDVLYHLTNCAQQLGFDHEELKLFLSGDVVFGSEEFNVYRNYHRDVEIHFGFEMPKVDVKLSDLRKQAFMSLLNQFACVS